MPTPTYFYLAKAEVTGATAASLSFTNISADYYDLLLRVSLRANSGNLPAQNQNFCTITLNSQSMSNSRNGEADGTSTNANSVLSIGGCADNNMGAGIFSCSEIYITGYQVSGTKILITRNTVNDNSAGTGYSARQQYFASTFNNPTGAITDITIAPGSGSFVQYSSAYLYGLKKS